MKKEIVIQIQVMAIILLIAFSEFAPVSSNIAIVVRIVAFLWTLLNGIYFVILDIKNKRYISSNSIILIASTILYFVGYFSSAIIIVCGNIIINCQFLYINNLMLVRKKEYTKFLKGNVKVFVNGSITEKEVGEVKKGNIFLVETEDKILVDGEVFHGNGQVEDYFSSNTDKIRKGDKVYAGSINKGQSLQIEATTDGNLSFLNDVIRRYEVADEYGSNKSRRAAKRLQIAFIVILIISFGIMSIPMFFNNITYMQVGIFSAIILSISSIDKILEINCIGLRKSIFLLYKNHIYCKKIDDIDTSSKVSLIGFEKSEDFIKERYDVVKIHNENTFSKEEILVYSAHCEYKSDHIIGKGIKEAFLQLAKYKGITRENPLRADFITKFEELHGMGVSARIKGRFVCVGNKKLMRLLNIVNIKEPDDELLHIHIAIDGKYAGFISLKYREVNYMADFKSDMKNAEVRRFGAFDLKDEQNFANIIDGRSKREKFAWILGKKDKYDLRPQGDIIYILADKANKNHLAFSDIFFKNNKVNKLTNFLKDTKQYFKTIFNFSGMIVAIKILLYTLALLKLVGIGLIFAIDSMIIVGLLFGVDSKANKIFNKKSI